uniref:Uncharacterized protein n=1 Tax=Magallana gigas TaxID=29159 RepID=A0A8W8J223_MAGGI
MSVSNANIQAQLTPSTRLPKIKEDQERVLQSNFSSNRNPTDLDLTLIAAEAGLSEEDVKGFELCNRCLTRFYHAVRRRIDSVRNQTSKIADNLFCHVKANPGYVLKGNVLPSPLSLQMVYFYPEMLAMSSPSDDKLTPTFAVCYELCTRASTRIFGDSQNLGH